MPKISLTPAQKISQRIEKIAGNSDMDDDKYLREVNLILKNILKSKEDIEATPVAFDEALTVFLVENTRVDNLTLGLIYLQQEFSKTKIIPTSLKLYLDFCSLENIGEDEFVELGTLILGRLFSAEAELVKCPLFLQKGLEIVGLREGLSAPKDLNDNYENVRFLLSQVGYSLREYKIIHPKIKLCRNRLIQLQKKNAKAEAEKEAAATKII